MVFEDLGFAFPVLPVWMLTTLTILIIWSVFWKGFALWRAAKNNSIIWFIVLLVVNTFGILEILYLFVFSKNRKKKRNR